MAEPVRRAAKDLWRVVNFLASCFFASTYLVHLPCIGLACLFGARIVDLDFLEQLSALAKKDGKKGKRRHRQLHWANGLGFEESPESWILGGPPHAFSSLR